MNIRFTAPSAAPSGTLVLTLAEGRPPPPSLAALDGRAGGAVGRLLARAGFTGRAAEVLEMVAPPGTALDRLVVVGLGDPPALDPLACRKAGGAVVAALEAADAGEATILAEPVDGAPLPSQRIAAEMAYGARLRSYRFDRYRSRPRPDDRGRVGALTIEVPDAAAAEALFRPLSAVADGVVLARDLVNEPGNALTPAVFVDRVRPLAALGVEVAAFGPEDLQQMGAGALLAVGRGSANPPWLLTLAWKGAADPAAAPVALVGKGITFDTGGLSLKRGDMADMRGDMAGGAAVVGAIAALAGRRARANVVGVVPLAENMAGADAFRPGDVVTSLSGRTIEVIDTDAEGRMVLADALHYAVTTFRPRAVVDIATLTGSIIRALGHRFAGLFATDDALAAALLRAGTAEDERLWRMPLDPYYDDNLRSDIADLRQVAPDDESADAIHGAALLGRFVGGVPWAHIDTGRLTQARKDTPLCPQGATGFGVRLFDRWVADAVED